MQRWIRRIEVISSWVGKAFGWLILVLTAVVSYDVLARYVFLAPTDWAFDVSYMAYGAMFIMAGAYTLARDGHVRGDFIYSNLRPRTQAALDLTLYLVFFLPGIAALVYSGWDFARMSWHLREHSSLTAGGPPVYPLKALIPVAGALVLVQGVAEMGRCILCLRTGEWPARLKDAEEIDVVETQLAQSKLVSEDDKRRAQEQIAHLEATAKARHAEEER